MSTENTEIRTTNVAVDAPDGAQYTDRADVGSTEIFRWIYRFFYSKTVGLILILLFAAYAVIGSVITQASAETFADAGAKKAFLDQVGGAYGAFTPILSALGFFHAFTSVGFYVVVGLLALSVIACTVHRIPKLVDQKRRPRVHVSEQFFARARYRGRVGAPGTPENAALAVREVLKGNRFRVLDDPSDPERSIYADRYAWSGIGTVLAHLSFVVILAAFLVTSTFGVEELKYVTVGGETEVGHGTDLVLVAHSFTDAYTEDGRPSDYVSDLSLLSGSAAVARQEVRVNSPLVYKSLRFHQQTFGIAADLSIEVADGTPIFQGAVPLQWTSRDGRNAVGRIELPEQNLEVIVATPASGQVNSSIPAGMAAIEVYSLDDGKLIEVSELSQGETESIAGLQYTFEREAKYTGILLRQDPGAPLMWIGGILLVVGMCITFMFQYRRIWVRCRPNEEGEEAGSQIRFGGVSRYDSSYQRLFENIVAEVSEALDAPAGQITNDDRSKTSEGAK